MSEHEQNGQGGGEIVEGMAIIGLAGRFPGAEDAEGFWRNLAAGVESIARFSREELLAAGVPAPFLDAPGYVPAGGALAGIEDFDAGFFGFNATEAEVLDPQIRLFLEQCSAALEDAGCDPFRYPGLIGLYGGMFAGQYLVNNLMPNHELLRQTGDLRLRIYSDKDFLASLTAYKLNLRGPCFTVQSACSTSLVAAALACQSLATYQCDVALAGGVTVPVPAISGYFAHEGVFAPDGHCRAFDAAAQGTVGGSGVGVVVLKRLADALRDGDRVRAVVRGWAVNNDGAAKQGYTTPSLDGQAEVVAMAQAMAGVDAESITYIETHGTATPLGDAVEIAALTQVFAEQTSRRGFCAVGSVKTNIGHLDAAAGAAGLIKTVLALEHGELPASLHFTRPNPQIDFAATPFYVNAEHAPWRRGVTPRRAGVSAFAVGGVNAHLILEEAPVPSPRTGRAREHQLLLVSARSEAALEAATARLAAHLESSSALGPETARGDSPEHWLADLAHTSQLGRRQFGYRRVLVASEVGDAARCLAARTPRRVWSGHAGAGVRPVAFLFPGLGNHYAGMGAELYQSERVYREEIDRCAELLRGEMEIDLHALLARPSEPRNSPGNAPGKALGNTGGGGPDLRRMLARGEARDEAPAGELIHTRLAQPAVFAQEWALAQLWRSWGVEPQAVFGYSIGEYVAAAVAGIFTLEDALRLVARRALAIDRLPGGAMLAVPLGERELAPLLALGALSIAAVNGPESSVLAGPVEDISRAEAALGARGIASRRAQTSHAFHSSMMRAAGTELGTLLTTMPRQAPRIPVVSCLTGAWLTAERSAEPSYWVEQMCGAVRLGDALETLLASEELALLEVGPGQALTAWAMQHPAAAKGGALVALPSLRSAFDDQPDQAFLLQTLGRLWLAGVEIDWEAFAAGDLGRRVALPTYPFERSRYWIDAPAEGAMPAAAASPAGVLAKRPDPASWFYLPVFREAPALAASAMPLAGTWWIVDGGEVGAELQHRLTARGAHVVAASANDDFARLLAEAPPARVVDLGAVRAARETSGDPEIALERGFFAPMALVQALGPAASGAGVRLDLVTPGVLAVRGDEPAVPEAAAVLGLARVARQEVPGLDTRVIDVDARETADLLASRLERELTGASAELAVALSGRRRWVSAFEPRPAASSAAPPWKEGGVYLVTGGLGGVGLTLARRLASDARARLVLAARRGLPPRELWAAHGAGTDETARRIAAVRELEALGAEVWVAELDVANREGVRALFAEVRRRWGRLDGVIHAAGVFPAGLLQAKTREAAAAVLAPKVAGTRFLLDALREDPPDFVLLCSSLTARLGGVGLADHAAANAVLDAFAERERAASGLPVSSLAWDTWLEVGQAARAARELAEGETGLRGSEGSDEGLSERAIEHPLWQRHLEGASRSVFELELRCPELWVLDEHRLGGRGLLPGTAYLELLVSALRAADPAAAVVVEGLVFARPLFVGDGESRRLRLVLDEAADGRRQARFESRAAAGAEGDDGWVEHARAAVVLGAETLGEPGDLAAWRAAGEERAGEASETESSATGGGLFAFGPRWQRLVRRAYVRDHEVLAELALPAAFRAEAASFLLHPALLDAATGVAQLFGEGPYLPLGYDRLTVLAPVPAEAWSRVRRLDGRGSENGGGATLACDLRVYDVEGRECLRVEGYTLRRLETELEGTSRAGEPAARLANAHGLELGLTPSEGAEVFARWAAAFAGEPRVSVSCRDLPVLVTRAEALDAAELMREATALTAGRRRHARTLRQTPYVAPRNELETQLCNLWRELLGVEEIGVEDGFFDIGGDSLLATQLLGRIGHQLGVALPLRALFEAPTVALLALRIVEAQAAARPREEVDALLAEIEALTGDEVEALLNATDAGRAR